MFCGYCLRSYDGMNSLLSHVATIYAQCVQSDMPGAPSSAIPVEANGSSMIHLGEPHMICSAFNIVTDKTSLLFQSFYRHNHDRRIAFRGPTPS